MDNTSIPHRSSRVMVDRLITALLLGALVAMVFFAGDAWSMQGQGVFVPSAPRVDYWQFIGILIAPGALAVSLTILFIRYQKVFAADEGWPLSRRQVFRRTIITGAFFGPASQLGLQKAVQYLTGMAPYWELVGLGAIITGLASMAVYEAIRWWMARKIKKGEADWRPAYDWLSAKPEEHDEETGDDVGHLTRFMREDTTEPRGDE